VDTGPCTEEHAAWYFDSNTRACQAFIYGGCGGNANRFESEEQCERHCGSFKDQDVCNVPYVSGPCYGTFQKWYYNPSLGGCQEFVYGGCGGNGNRFSSLEECERICLHHEELLPPGNDTALSNQANEIDVDSGPEKPSEDKCQAASLECTVLQCPYGVERFVDPDVCVRCQCHDPCKDYSCPDQTQCAVDLYHNPQTDETEYRGVCRPTNKTGECPKFTVSDGNCVHECQSDADCTGDTKCCFSGCVSSCLNPVFAEHLTTQGPHLPPQPYGEPGDEAPAFEETETEPQVRAEEGNYVILRCVARGRPVPTITWTKGAIVIDGSGRYKLLLDGSLQIIGLYRKDSGVYICTADNGIGRPIQREFQLEVTVPVQANISLTRTVYPIGSDISIPCDVDGYPIPQVVWYKDEELLEPSERIHITENHRLLIVRANGDDAGTYRCSASNQYGQSSSSISIAVEGVYIHPNCTDNPFFANCRLIVAGQYCTHKYYARFCCKSCTQAGQLPSYGPHLEKSGTSMSSSRRK
jgi:hypothetical protein